MSNTRQSVPIGSSACQNYACSLLNQQGHGNLERKVYTVNSPLMDTLKSGPLPNDGYCLMYSITNKTHCSLGIIETLKQRTSPSFGLWTTKIVPSDLHCVTFFLSYGQWVGLLKKKKEYLITPTFATVSCPLLHKASS